MKKLIIELPFKLPWAFRELPKLYRQVIGMNQWKPAWTLSGDLELVECEGSVGMHESWNYHNNYDDSEPVLCVRYHGHPEGHVEKWFTLNKEEAVALQKSLAKEYLEVLEKHAAEINEQIERYRAMAK